MRTSEEILSNIKSIAGGEDENSVKPPSNYKPLTIQQRTDWNKFADYLSSKGVAGSKDLDQRDQNLWLQHYNEFKKANPDTTITPDIIPNVQYEQYQLRKGNQFGNFTSQELQEYRKGLSPNFINAPTSPIDGWVGSITSKLYYPQSKLVFNPTAASRYNKGQTDMPYTTDVETQFRRLKSIK